MGFGNRRRLEAVRPDVSKFCHLGKYLKAFRQFLNGIFSICQTCVPTFHFYAAEQIVIVVNGQKYNRLVTLFGKV